MKVLERIVDALRSCQTICVVGHVRPDGDCIGSQLGLTLALRQQGKTVTCWNQDEVPSKLAFLDPERLLRKPQAAGSFDGVVATDCASYERLGEVGNFIRDRRLLVNIDHHASNTRYGDVNWVSPRAPSTGELIYLLLRKARWPVSPPIADCLFTAISTDTGSFQYPSTRPTSYHVAGELVQRGANLEKICHEVYQSYPLSRVRLLQRLYNGFRLAHENQIAYFWLRPSDFERTGADQADSEGLIDHLRAIETVVVACIFEELEPDLIRLSLRSKSTAVDVNRIAAQFGGGGHVAAAGARTRGSAGSVQRRVIGAIKEALDAVR